MIRYNYVMPKQISDNPVVSYLTDLETDQTKLTLADFFKSRRHLMKPEHVSTTSERKTNDSSLEFDIDRSTELPNFKSSTSSTNMGPIFSTSEPRTNSDADEETLFQKVDWLVEPNTSILLYGGQRITDTEDIEGGYNLHRVNLTNGNVVIVDPPSHQFRNRQAAAAVEANSNQAYIVGGLEIGNEPSLVSWRLTVDGTEELRTRWTRIADLNIARVHHALVTHRGRPFAIGGLGKNGGILDSVEIYDPTDDKWTILTNAMPQPCLGLAACVYRDLIWIIGGINRLTGTSNKTGYISRTVYAFNDVLNTWYLGAPLPLPRAFARAIILQNEIHIIGGIGFTSSSKTGHRSVDYLDTGTNKWKTGSYLNNARHHFAIVGRPDILYVIGGVSPETDKVLTSIEKFNPETRIWVDYALTNPFTGSECIG